MRKLERKVWQWCQQESLLEQGDRVLLGLSGGPDSVALLRILMALRQSLQLQLYAGHLDHSLRGSESDSDREFVKDLCRRLRIPLACHRLPPESLAGRGNLEARLRQLRYDFLLDEARQRDAILATGHTLDDQAETVLLRAARGAGARGLAGIPPLRTWRGIRIVRPLLDCAQCDILAYLGELGQAFRLDPSNQDLNFDRNWTRLQLLPLLEKRLNPRIRQALGRSARLLREMHDDLRHRAREALRSAGTRRGDHLSLGIASLRSFSRALRRQVVLEAVGEIRGHQRGLDLNHIEAALDLLNQPSGHSRSLPGCQVWREFDHLTFVPPREIAEFSYQLSVPGQVLVKETGRIVTVKTAQDGNHTAQELVLQVPGNSIIVRNRRPGDTMRWNGHSRKLKSLMLEHRIPRQRRSLLLVIEQQGVVSAVEEIGVAEGFAGPEPRDRRMRISIGE